MTITNSQNQLIVHFSVQEHFLYRSLFTILDLVSSKFGLLITFCVVFHSSLVGISLSLCLSPPLSLSLALSLFLPQDDDGRVSYRDTIIVLPHLLSPAVGRSLLSGLWGRASGSSSSVSSGSKSDLIFEQFLIFCKALSVLQHHNHTSAGPAVDNDNNDDHDDVVDGGETDVLCAAAVERCFSFSSSSSSGSSSSSSSHTHRSSSGGGSGSSTGGGPGNTSHSSHSSYSYSSSSSPARGASTSAATATAAAPATAGHMGLSLSLSHYLLGIKLDKSPESADFTNGTGSGRGREKRRTGLSSNGGDGGGDGGGSCWIDIPKWTEISNATQCTHNHISLSLYPLSLPC